MINELMDDYRWMSFTGLGLFIAGFAFNTTFLMLLGTSFSIIGVSLFSIIDKELSKRKGI